MPRWNSNFNLYTYEKTNLQDIPGNDRNLQSLSRRCGSGDNVQSSVVEWFNDAHLLCLIQGH